MENYYTDNPSLKFHLQNPKMEKIVELKEHGFSQKDLYDIAPVDYEDALMNYDAVMEVVGEICGTTIADNAESVDQEGATLKDNQVIYAKGTQENLNVLKDAGLMGVMLPREYDGLNFPMSAYIMIAEIIARADAGFMNIWGLQDCADTINEFATDDQKERFLHRIANGATAAMALTEPDAGSDLQSVQLKATFNEIDNTWYLNGVKRFITNGDADVVLVLARSEEGTTDGRGLSMFLYDKRNKGVTIRRLEHKLGITGSPTCEMVFKNAPAELVGSRRMGLIKYVMSLMNSARLGIAAQSVGISEAAYHEALKYANERKQYGKTIINLPAVNELLYVMKAKLDASRSLLYETARFVDTYKLYSSLSKERKLLPEEQAEMKRSQKLADFFTPLVKGLSSEYCNQNVYDSMQIHGGSGYMTDYPIERIYRDARITSIYEGTTQLQVVSAIKGVTTRLCLERIKEYASMEMSPECAPLGQILEEMTNEFEKTVDFVTEKNNALFLDIHARRLVEMAGNIIMGYLLLLDSCRDDRFMRSATLFINRAKSENLAKSSYILQ